MIVDNTYFIDEIYIPHAKPALTSNVTGVSEDIINFIAEYERECLIKCFGFQLFKEFYNELDATQSNGLKTTANSKWDDLLNGKSYTSPTSNKVVEWRGIRLQNTVTTPVYNISFIAQYIYFFYERNYSTRRSSAGHQIETSKNAEIIGYPPKVINAWNKFINKVQGEDVKPKIIYTQFGMGVDYWNGGYEINLYQFINDMNNLTVDTYADFTPKTWTKLNQFGI